VVLIGGIVRGSDEGISLIRIVSIDTTPTDTEKKDGDDHKYIKEH
jgi:hypothetical protein